jgi:transcriptional regulator with XRE-family HTH domain
MSRSRRETTVGRLIGHNLREIRGERGLTQEEAAVALQAVGLPWTRAHVASLESGRREDLTLGELLLLCAAFRAPLLRWFKEDEPGMIRLGDGAAAAGVDIRAVLTGQNPADLLGPVLTQEPLHSDVEMHAARRLGVAPAEVRTMARRLWGRTLIEEREARLDQEASHAAGPAKGRRGHITRALLREIRGAGMTQPVVQSKS